MKKTLIEEKRRILEIIFHIDESFNVNNGNNRYKNLIDFIGESPEYLTYLHTTQSEDICRSICKEGLIFEEFNKTTDLIYDSVSLLYMLMIRKEYGNFTIIIQINKNIKRGYEEISKKNDNETFTLPPTYIKGYYNRATKEIVSNPLFGKPVVLSESDEDIDWDLYEKLDDIKREVLTGFFNDKQRGIKEQPWTLVPFARLKKIWEDFMSAGVVRDTRGLEMIENIIQTNIIKLYVNTELCGYTPSNPDYDFEEYNYTEEDKEEFYSYIDKISDYAFNDFGGRRLGLLTLLTQLRKSKTAEEKVPIIDQILNVIHQRNDLASWFVEGGSSALGQLSGSPSEALNESKYNEQKDALMRSKSISKEMKKEILKYFTGGSTYKEGRHVYGLSKPKELMDKSPKADGVSMGADKNGFFVYTHRARSGSHAEPGKIPVKEINFIETTG